MIFDDVRAEFKNRKTAKSIPANLIVEFVTSTFVQVLNWWIESLQPVPPSEADDVFRTLVLPTLTALRG